MSESLREVVDLVCGLQSPLERRVDILEVTAANRFWQFAAAMNKGKLDSAALREKYGNRPLLALDPGETTGACIWLPKDNSLLIFQLGTPEIEGGWRTVHELLQKLQPEHVRIEDYRVYGHMTDQHSFAGLHTPQLIGAIKAAACDHEIPSSVAMAIHAKTFWTDAKLKMCGLYNRGLKHGRDAQRHVLRYMCE